MAGTTQHGSNPERGSPEEKANQPTKEKGRKGSEEDWQIQEERTCCILMVGYPLASFVVIKWALFTLVSSLFFNLYLAADHPILKGNSILA